MSSKKVLGRGLGAFFPEYNEGSESENADKSKASSEKPILLEPRERVNVILNIPLEDVRTNPHQPRKEFDDTALEELAQSVKQHGLIQPITVRYIGERRFELISGERRLRAAKLAGFKEIPSYIREADDEQSMSFALIENIQRADLNILEIASAYKRLLEEFNYTQQQVAEQVGKSRVAVTNTLRLLQLPDFVLSSLKAGAISAGHARALVTIEDESLVRKLLQKILKDEWSVRQIEEAVRLSHSNSKDSATTSSKPKTFNPFTEEISKRLRQAFGTKVEIKQKSKGGEIRIEYYSDDDLERILGILD